MAVSHANGPLTPGKRPIRTPEPVTALSISALTQTARLRAPRKMPNGPLTPGERPIRKMFSGSCVNSPAYTLSLLPHFRFCSWLKAAPPAYSPEVPALGSETGASGAGCAAGSGVGAGADSGVASTADPLVSAWAPPGLTAGSSPSKCRPSSLP